MSCTVVISTDLPVSDRSCQDMSEWITSDTGIQPCDPNSNSMATVEASSTSIFKNRPLRGGWGRWIGGRDKAREFRRVGSLALVGGDGLVVVSLLQRVFPLSSYPRITPWETSHQGRCEISWEGSQWTYYFSGFLLSIGCVVLNNWNLPSGVRPTSVDEIQYRTSVRSKICCGLWT